MVEHDPLACRTLKKAFPSAHVLKADLREVDLGAFAGVDLLAGGPPCTPYSQAGRRGGATDGNDLMPRAVELIESLRPRAIMLENVPGILERGNDLHRLDILGRLFEAGYRCEWREVKAWEFGVPQARKRAILVGFREPAAMARFAWPPPAPTTADEFYAMSSALYDHFRVNGYEPSEGLMDGLTRLSPTITGGSPNKEGADLGQENTRKVWREMGVDPRDVSLTAPAADHVGPPKLSIRMVAALQGFFGDWPFQGGRVAQFKQIANAFPPIVALHLGCAIASALTGEKQDYRREVFRLGAAAGLRAWSRRPSDDDTAPINARPSTRRARTKPPLNLGKLAALEKEMLIEDESAQEILKYPPYEGDDEDEREAEHYVEYWEALEAARALEAEVALALEAIPGTGQSDMPNP